MVDRNKAHPGVAWACRTCWKLFTVAGTVERTGKQHFAFDGNVCSGHGQQAFKVQIDQQGHPVPGSLPPGVICPRAAPESCWAGSTLHPAPSAAYTAAPTPPPTVNHFATGGLSRPSRIEALNYRQTDASFTTPAESTMTEASASVQPQRPSLIVVLHYTPPRPPSPATIAAYYPYHAPRPSFWSTHNSYGPPLEPGEDDPAGHIPKYWRSIYE